MNPEHLDIKTAVEEWKTTTRRMLLLAHEDKIKIGIKVKDRQVLFLRNGMNVHIKPGKAALHRAYEGAQSFTGFLPLNHRQILGLLKRGYISTSEFSYHKNDYDQALLLLGNQAHNKAIKIDDLFIEQDISQVLKEKKRAHNAMKILIIETTTKLALELGYKPAAKEVFKKLEKKKNDEYALPIVKIEGTTIFWDDGFKALKTMSFRTLSNILAQMNHG